MATVIKKISELEQLTDLSSSSNVIIEENGNAKRFSAQNLGKVKTVNGIEPDENGNIEVTAAGMPEINFPVTSVNGMTGDVVIEVGSGGNGVTSWNDLTDKPFYESSGHFVVEWDGNTEGLDVVSAEVLEDFYLDFYKVSDLTPKQEEILGGYFSFNFVNPVSGAVLIEGDDYCVSTTFIVIRKDNCAFTIECTGEDIELFFPKAGIYLGSANEIKQFTSCLTYGTEKITWDGNIEGLECVKYSEDMSFYKVSDSTPSNEELTNTTAETTTLVPITDGQIHELGTKAIAIEDLNYVCIVYETGEEEVSGNVINWPSTGIYFASMDDSGDGEYDVEYRMHTNRFAYGDTVVHTIEDKFIPDTIARKSDITWDNLPDKPFGEEGSGVTIEWDGNTEGRESTELLNGVVMYKLSDVTPTQSELTGGVMGGLDPMHDNVYIEQELTDEMLSSTSNFNCVNCMLIGNVMVAYGTEISILGNAFTLTSAGLWASDGFRKLNYGSYSIKTLDEKYIPDIIARKSDIVASGVVSSWNDLTDKPFYDGELLFDFIIENATETILDSNGNVDWGKFSDIPPVFEELRGRVFTTYNQNGDVVATEKINGKITWPDLDGCYGVDIEIVRGDTHHTLCSVMVVEVDTLTEGSRTFSKGVWASLDDDGSGTPIIRATIADENKTIDPKYMPPCDWAENNSLFGTHIKNRTHYVESYQEYTFDGDTNGLGEPIAGLLYRIADGSEASALTNDMLRTAKFTVTQVSDMGFYQQEVFTSDHLPLLLFEEDYALIGEYIAVVRKDNVTIGEIDVANAGIYLLHVVHDGTEIYISKLSIPEKVVTLPEFYIPDTIARKYDLPHYEKGDLIYDGIITTTKSSDSDIIPESSIGGIRGLLASENWYVVEFSGVEYVCKYSRNPVVTYDSYYLGNAYMYYYRTLIKSYNYTEERADTLLSSLGLQDIEPFFILGTGHVATKEAGTYAINIYKANITKIQEQYIPDGFIHVDDVYDNGELHPVRSYMWDESVVYDEVVNVPDNGLYSGFAKISDDAPESDYFIGKYIYASDKESVESDCAVLSSSDIDEQDGCYAVGNMVVVTNESVNISDGVTLTSGIWFADGFDRTEFSYPHKIRITDKRLLSDTVIPDTIARVSNVVTSVNGMTGDVVIEATSGGGVTSWNDLEDKPFGEEHVGTDTVALYRNDNLTFETDDDAYLAEINEAIDFIEGETYTVEWDSKEYVCTCTVSQHTDDYTMFALGNMGIASTVYPNTGEPFAIQYMRNSDGTFICRVASTSTSNVHSVAIYSGVAHVNTLDEKYIPDTIARSAASHNLAIPDATGETVSAAEFNALLAILREAGYLAT